MNVQQSFKIAFISDLHVDFYVPAGSNGYKLEKRMNDYIDNHLKLQNADILVFAGDNSHYPQQNATLLKLIANKKIYKKIFITFGNHDLYLISNNQKNQFKYSWEKVLFAKKLYSEIEGVEFLDGNVVDVDGFKIGGTGMWYDFSYGIDKHNHTEREMHELWNRFSNDANLIFGRDAPNTVTEKFDFHYDSYGGRKREIHASFNPLNFFKQEKEKMEKIIHEVDVFVSHVGPTIPPNLLPKYDRPEMGFYFFDGGEYLLAENSPKLWIFGHVHTRCNYKIGNTRLVCNPLGYKDQNLKHQTAVIDLSTIDGFNFDTLFIQKKIV